MIKEKKIKHIITLLSHLSIDELTAVSMVIERMTERRV